jgi:hypothetical protein
MYNATELSNSSRNKSQDKDCHPQRSFYPMEGFCLTNSAIPILVFECGYYESLSSWSRWHIYWFPRKRPLLGTNRKYTITDINTWHGSPSSRSMWN